jgi:hypothetical protein
MSGDWPVARVERRNDTAEGNHEANVVAVCAASTLTLAPDVAAAPSGDPDQWPIADNAAYTAR